MLVSALGGLSEKLPHLFITRNFFNTILKMVLIASFFRAFYKRGSSKKFLNSGC